MAFVAGQKLTAAVLNAEIGLGAWTSYVPTLTQGVAVLKTIPYAKYTRVGRLVIAQGYMDVTSAGTANQTITVSLPVTSAHPSSLVLGSGMIADVSAPGYYAAMPILNNANTVFFVHAAATSGAALMVAALAAGDNVRFLVAYEAAT